jgi:addiction module HigA family antidote
MQESFSLERFGARLRRIRDELIGSDQIDIDDDLEDEDLADFAPAAVAQARDAERRIEPVAEAPPVRSEIAVPEPAVAAAATPLRVDPAPLVAPATALRPVEPDDVFPVHPGLTLAAEIAVRSLSAHALALRLRVPANRISGIVNGRRSITPETALRLGRFFGTPPEFWMDLQTRYDLAVARRQLGAEITRDVGPV